MKEIYTKKTYKLYEECTDQEKKDFIEKYRNNQIFYDNAYELYDELVYELFENTNNESKFLSVDRTKLYWNSNSQGWYFERGADFLHGYFEITKKNWKCSMEKISLKNLHHLKDFIEYTSFIKVLPNGDEEEFCFNHITNKQIQKYFFNQIKKMYEECKKFMSKLNDIINEYVAYYPTDEEIIDFLINNEIEYQTAEEQIKEIA